MKKKIRSCGRVGDGGRGEKKKKHLGPRALTGGGENVKKIRKNGGSNRTSSRNLLTSIARTQPSVFRLQRGKAGPSIEEFKMKR